MFEISSLAEHRNDACQSACAPDGKPGDFAKAMHEAARAERAADRAEARQERREAKQAGASASRRNDDAAHAAHKAARRDDEIRDAENQSVRQAEDDAAAASETETAPRTEEDTPPTQDVSDTDAPPRISGSDAEPVEAAAPDGGTAEAALPAPAELPVEDVGGDAEIGAQGTEDAIVVQSATPAEESDAVLPENVSAAVTESEAGEAGDTVLPEAETSAVVTDADASAEANAAQAASTGEELPAETIITTAGDGEAPAPAAETASPTAAQEADETAPTTDSDAASAIGQTADETGDPESPGKAAPPDHTPDWAAHGALPPRSPIAQAILDAKGDTPSAPPVLPAAANGKPGSAGADPAASGTPSATAQTATAATGGDATPGLRFDPPGLRADAAADSDGTPRASAGAIPAPASGGGQTNTPAQTGTDTGAAQAQAQAQAAAAAAADRPLPAPDPLPADTRPTGTPQIQPATPAGSFGNELRAAADLSPATATAAGRAAPSAAAQQIAFQIGRSVQNGNDRFTLELRPADLGRVSVKMEIGFDHRVIAVISADRADTLDLLQRDARLLERALQDTGLKADSGSLSFSLSGGGQDGYDANDGVPAGQHATMALDDELAAAVEQAPVASYAPTDGSGVNIQV